MKREKNERMRFYIANPLLTFSNAKVTRAYHFLRSLFSHSPVAYFLSRDEALRSLSHPCLMQFSSTTASVTKQSRVPPSALRHMTLTEDIAFKQQVALSQSHLALGVALKWNSYIISFHVSSLLSLCLCTRRRE